MKHTTTFIAAILVATSCSYNRVESLTMVSTRNVDPTKPGELILRNVEAKAKTKHDDALQEAIEEACRQHPGGEYMMNVAVYVKGNGNWIKVQGDVWGRPVQQDVATPVQTGGIDLAVGHTVAFKRQGKLVTGTIVGMRPSTALVEFTKSTGGKDMREVPLGELTKVTTP